MAVRQTRHVHGSRSSGQHRSGAVSVHRWVKDQEGSAEAAISEEEYSVGRRLS